MLVALAGAALAGAARCAAAPGYADADAEALRLAITDLVETFGKEYPKGAEYRARLKAIEADKGLARTERTKRLAALRQEALLANPLLEFGRLLLVKRKPHKKARGQGAEIGFPSNHECNSSLPRTGWDNEIAVLEPVRPDGRLRTLYKPEGGGYVGEIDLHPDADRLLFTRSDATNWKVWELALADGARAGRLRQVSRMPDDVDAFDGCYLPDGRIVFCSTASFQSRAAVGQFALPHGLWRRQRAAGVLRPGPRFSPDGFADRAGSLQPLGLHRHHSHLPAPVDDDEPGRHGPAGRLRQQVVVPELVVLHAARARPGRPLRQHPDRVPRPAPDGPARPPGHRPGLVPHRWHRP